MKLNKQNISIIVLAYFLILFTQHSSQNKYSKIFNDELKCDITKIEEANQAQLNSILTEIVNTEFFKFFKVNLDEVCPFQKDKKQNQDQQQQQTETCNYKPPSFGGGSLPFGKEEKEAEPACSIKSHVGELFNQITDKVDRTAPEKEIHDYKDCQSPVFWLDICNNIPTNKAGYINLLLNPERYTGYNGSHVWQAIYDEQCFMKDEESCFEEQVLYKLMSGIHSATTIGIAVNYYPPGSKSKNWEPNPEHFMKQFKDQEDWLENLHFSFSFMLKSVYKASSFLLNHPYNSNGVPDNKTRILINRFLESHMLQDCEPAFLSFDESKMFAQGDNKEVKKQFKQAFMNISDLLNCVSCQKCKLHAKLSLLGIGTAMKLLLTPEKHILDSISREEVVALINTLHKFSSSIQYSKKLRLLYQQNLQRIQEDQLALQAIKEGKQKQIIKEQNERYNSQEESGNGNQWAVQQSKEGFNSQQLDKAVKLVAELSGKIDEDFENQLIDYIFQHDERIVILANNYGQNVEKFLQHTQRVLKLKRYIKQENQIKQFDAIVIGSGLAGMTTALNLLDRGGSVILIEKENHLGGNSAMASSGINGLKEGASTGDSNLLFLKDTLKSKNPNEKLQENEEEVDELTYILTRESKRVLQWIADRLKLNLDQVGQLGGHSVPRTHRPSQGMIGAELVFAVQTELKKYFSSGRLQIKLQTKAKRFILNEQNAVIGVEVQENEEKNLQTLTANTIVLATGGFANDRQENSFIKNYQPTYTTIPSTNGKWAQGDGVRMGIDIGADLIDMDKIQLHPTGFIDPKDPKSMTKPLCGEIMRGVGGLLLDKKGNRFCNELGTRAYVTKQMQQLGEDSYTLILNEKAANSAKKHVDLYHFRGLLTKVNNLREAAEILKIPVQNLQKTFEKYNSFSNNEGNSQDEFGKKVFKSLPYEDNEIYYIGHVQPVLHYTMGGLKIDSSSRVLRKGDGKPIENLFGVGEVTGGVHGQNRLGGNSLLECALFGLRVSDKIQILSNQEQQQSQESDKIMKKEENQDDNLKLISEQELKQNNGRDSKPLWIALQGKIYDFSSFEHPGGEESLLNCAGKECKDIFESIHNWGMLEDFKPIGKLIEG